MWSWHKSHQELIIPVLSMSPLIASKWLYRSHSPRLDCKKHFLMFADTAALKSCESKHLYLKCIPDFRLENSCINFTENLKLFDYYVRQQASESGLFQIWDLVWLPYKSKLSGRALNSCPSGSSSLQGCQTLGVNKGAFLRRLSPALCLNLPSGGPRHHRTQTNRPCHLHTWASQPRSKITVAFATNFRVASYISQQ